ncbi:MAG: tellurium resistance protein TerC [Hyphomicrobiales bacterium]|nr:tellurium resistance protein TerC [Hyphomicrobiales bacterium]
MESILSLDNMFTLLMLILLQAVLGFDNLLYISIESKRAPAAKQKIVRQMGIGLAIFLRIGLLFVLINAIQYFQDSLFAVHFPGIAEGDFNGHSLIVLFGGIFIIYTAMKEIMHMLAVQHVEDSEGSGKKSITSIIMWIVIMNLVFSFDSILSAMALTDVFFVMATAIIISGILMIVLAERVAEFLKQNRMYEVLGLFVLFIVGIMLVSEGGHLAHIKLAGFPVEPMSKTTFYFVLIILLAVDVVQSQYRKRLMEQKAHEISTGKVSVG